MAMAMDLGYCGLDCAGCPAYHATERLTVEERQLVADRWNVEFGSNHTVDDIDCVGCTHEGKHAPYCNGMCDVRGCAIAKAVGTCAECGEYGCDKLTSFHAMAPEAKVNLEARRAN